MRLVSLNVAHGRSELAHQALLRRPTLEANLESIASSLRALDPDVVALQEADGPSSWSGDFDHVATLARRSHLQDHYRGDHNPFGVGRFRLATGTALLARYPLLHARSHRFAASWRDTKGFVVATVRVPAWGDLAIDVVSVHLDFLVPAIRRRQIIRLVDTLADRSNPLLVLGDLNCSWRREPRSMQLLTRTLGLSAFAPQASVPTYPSNRPRRRLDWILVSSELEYRGYGTLPGALSDHLGVVADIALRAS